MPDRISALYARVSTEEQAREGQSIENQIDRLSAYAQFQGWRNVQVFADEGVSAKDMKRPQMQKLLRLIQNNQVAVVATMAVDRLSRDLLDMLQFVQLCEQHQTAYVCAALNFDTSSPIGRMTLQILAAFAEFERSLIATRVKTNMLDIAQKKRRYMAVPPYGYAYDEQKNLAVVPTEAIWVQRAADRFITGYGYSDVAKWLNSQGVTTRRGGSWEISTVRQMLTNELYIGRLIWNRRYYDKAGKLHWRKPSEWVVHDDAHAAILSAAQWAEIQTRVTRRMPQGGEKQMRYRLSGLLRCGECGAVMVARKYGTKGPHKARAIFVCSNYQKHGKCRFHYVFIDEADAEVYQALAAFAGENVAVPVDDLLNALGESEKDMECRLAVIQAKFQRQIVAYENGLIDKDDLQVARARVEKERELLLRKQPLGEAPSAGNQQLVLSEATQLLWLWNYGELPVLQTIMRQIVDHIVVAEGAVADIRLSRDLYAGD